MLNTSASPDCPSLLPQERQLLATLSHWLTGVGQTSACSLGLLSTLVSILVLSKQQFRKSIFCQLLLCLSVCDLLHLLCRLTYSIVSGCNVGFYLFSLLTPHLLHPLKCVSTTASIFLMVSLALERAQAVTRPLSRVPSGRSSRLLLRYLLPVILISLGLNAPKFYEAKITHINSTFISLGLTELRTNHYYVTYYSWLRLVVLGVLPTVAVSLLNLQIYSVVRRANRGDVQAGLRRNCKKFSGAGPPGKEPSDRPLLTILVAIVGIFLLSSIPRTIVLMHEVWIIDTIRRCIAGGRVGEGFPVWNLAIGYVSDLMLTINPTANFIVYSVYNAKFRSAIKGCLPCVPPCSQPSSQHYQMAPLPA